MPVEDPYELEALRAAGRVVAETLRELRRHVRPGVTTAELDDVAARVFARHGARSGPRLDYGFPGTVCLSVDDECVHGIPGPRPPCGAAWPPPRPARGPARSALPSGPRC